MNLNKTGSFLLKLAKFFLSSSAKSAPQRSSGSLPSLQALADQFEDELTDRTFVYTFENKNGNRYKAELEFDRSGFCHLFSIGSIAKGFVSDPDEYSGIPGWKNIRSGKITFDKLQKMNPEDFDYYRKEYEMAQHLFETIRNPQAVLYDASKVPGSKLKSDIMLYQIFDHRTVHLGISQDRDGTWFARSYFVRENSQDRQYPTKYIAPMVPLSVKVKVSSKNA